MNSLPRMSSNTGVGARVTILTKLFLGYIIFDLSSEVENTAYAKTFLSI